MAAAVYLEHYLDSKFLRKRIGVLLDYKATCKMRTCGRADVRTC